MKKDRRKILDRHITTDDDGIQHDTGILQQQPKPASNADAATDEMLRDLEGADELTRIARLAGGEH